MVKEFRKKLKEDGRSLKWFHRKFLIDSCTYIYFVSQVGGFADIREDIENAVKKYLED